MNRESWAVLIIVSLTLWWVAVIGLLIVGAGRLALLLAVAMVAAIVLLELGPDDD